MAGSKTSGGAGPVVHGEQRSGPVAGTALIDGYTFKRKGVMYANVDGLAIVEGDIVIGTVAQVQAAREGGVEALAIGITGAASRWPDARVPYEIDGALPNPQRVTDAIAHWEAKTRIRFVARTAANAAQFPDFVRFVPGGGCSSHVGRQGGQQSITLGPGCSAGNAIHEIGHTIGLWHEQSREDRDQFVTIDWSRIDPAMQHNFSQHISDGDDLGAYDFGSIMHYPAAAFSSDGHDTIVPRQPLPAGVVMGQRVALSAGDLAGVEALYPVAATIKELAKDPVQDTFKELAKDPVQDTFKELTKDPVHDTFKEIAKDATHDTFKELGKDPGHDTIKEAALDQGPWPWPWPGPGPDPGPYYGQPARPGDSPFILATPHQAASIPGPRDARSALLDVTRRLAALLERLEAERSGLMAEYQVAVRHLQSLGLL